MRRRTDWPATCTATLLPNGKLLVAGGVNGSGPVASAQLYNPASETWEDTGDLHSARYWHTATLLPNGMVFVAGGQGGSEILSSAELYDPSNGVWTVTIGMSTARFNHMATRLTSGQLLLAGGMDSAGTPTASAELIQPAVIGPRLARWGQNEMFTPPTCCLMAGCWRRVGVLPPGLSPAWKSTIRLPARGRRAIH